MMKTHTVEGQQMLDRVGGLLGEGRRWSSAPRTSASTARGYPDGLAGEDIPLAARIVSRVRLVQRDDHNRSYRQGMALEAAIEELRRCSGTQFDPQVVTRCWA